MKEVVILSAARSAGGKFGGSLASMTAPDFGAVVVRETIKRAGISPDVIDQSIIGNAWQAGVGPNPARITAVRAGVPTYAPAVSINVRCGSGIQAMIFGAQAIKTGDMDTVLVGGTESASQIPYALSKARWGYRMGKGELLDLMHKDGFFCPLGGGLMGELTDALAQELDIGRGDQDKFAAECHNKAEVAVKSGKFADEIVPIEVPARKGKATVFKDEEIFREGITAESLAKLKPVFNKNGTITAGNACALCDAAAAQVIMEREKAKAMGLEPMARIRGYAFIGYEPKRFGLAPVKAIPFALKQAGLELSDIDLIELNEAFAAQYIACERALNIDRNKVNVNGGAIALGHPVAATGAKLMSTLLYAMKDRDVQFGLVSLCIGGGNGVAVVVERL
ncbi:MAG: acetyl-CoA C-acyltransferase [Desulfobacterales bacterium]|jgi:acetyl-CoA C-acetyltransferase|nr:acetyl-CoA C-acyltransferase [Desulfobacter sp.]MDP6395062.1 acetyl-CoA C-acyltransferase [Desulfobacterales bacterium]MDP6683117.1 acetyl-CoA C-acyltransferase [Desulfobacterales bacterium]MDP6806462.1 acetyl-CoA C-acyltransferase [Desulfobacterales bacterium]|tara:strand:- start:97445 stop:98626 length:1182 start_codon:yes stop_codon:yes gene_type:complete